ncbi:MAG: HlyD family efflux transporter periplasmic adaptor subunit [Chlorobium limicola]|uniref:Secretion protein HlyD family protein n=1 Tax=Chlorobium limicola (strain DSM 245 / NBRC 103803 / 6330) TaxID=290315 RepID=B3EDZ9_CHLL2|nr:HlyD family efflux transporter periplasmic adaptor subunit [Chlorobium limicola]ACD90701.1 secretion protein HlyD family protein [Chlorobium limicola DSM 245]NTV07746.1 HlyD family efflux transporter periplasmic adaptor subunit [Chlorobium limicola]NTV21648.1 HlyD family efflux transporter periplasmic adaptor subunit [Chlorobium limicola]
MIRNPFSDDLIGQGEVFNQSATVPRIILWVLVLAFFGFLLWASIAKIDVSIPATGKLEPTGEVKSVQAAIEGEVSRLYVEDGRRVKKGEVLLDLVPVLSVGEESKLKSLQIALSNARQQYATESAMLSKLRSLLQSAAVSEFEVEQKKLDVLKLQAQIADLSEQINKQSYMANQATGYEGITAPVDGTVFDLQVKQGTVVSQGQIILKVVPDDQLTARAFISNQDIGFVYENLPVDVRLDAFPYAEFGDIKGKVLWVGSDVLPPDDIIKYYHFPIKVLLDQQHLMANGKKIYLQSGMSVTLNIKVRKRTVMSIFTDLFTQQVDAVSHIRK